MKKIFAYLLPAVFSGALFAERCCEEDTDTPCFTSALTTGFVFKHNDCVFKEVYGRGIENVITADLCYYPWRSWGIGGKVGYWRATGCTTTFKRCTLLQQIPVTFYLRGISQCRRGVQLYASLGGGVMVIKEKSYLGDLKARGGIGELEAGLIYHARRYFDLTCAFRYLFPRVCVCDNKIDGGGFDVRAGIGFSF